MYGVELLDTAEAAFERDAVGVAGWARVDRHADRLTGLRFGALSHLQFCFRKTH